MRKLVDLLNDAQQELDEQTNPYHIIVLVDEKDFAGLESLNEGHWKKSNESGYMQRVDTPHFDWQLLHVHIAREKHVNAKSKQVSWNDDGTRHDKKTFNNNFTGMEAAKRIARKALGLPDNFQLENVNVPEKMTLLLECVEYLPAKASLYIFHAQHSSNRRIL